MKTSGLPTRLGDSASSRSKTNETPPGKTFSKVLENRRGKDKPFQESKKSDSGEQKALRQRGKAKGEESLEPLAGFDGAVAQTSQAVPQASSVQSTAPKQQIDSLVQEIWHGVNTQGQEQVEIQLNSKVFEGLRIQIVRDAGVLDVRFQSRSDEVAQLLNLNTGALADSLTAHGIKVGQIRVNDSQDARWLAHKAQNRSRTGGQGRRRQS